MGVAFNAIEERWSSIEDRMAALEAKIGLPPCHVALASTEERWSVIERRLGALETATKLGDLTLEDSDEPQESEDPEYGRGWEPTEVTATQRRLADELRARGVADFAFRRVASSYYSWPLEGRRQALAAPSIHHLYADLGEMALRMGAFSPCEARRREFLARQHMLSATYSHRTPPQPRPFPGASRW